MSNFNSAVDDAECSYDVEEIIKKRTRNNKTEYLLKWVGNFKNSWEPEENLHCVEMIADFEIRQGHKILGEKYNRTINLIVNQNY